MSDESLVARPMIERVEPPAARSYRHRECGALTKVGGDRFRELANPFCLMQSIDCKACQFTSIPLRLIEWADTGEDLASYRKRLRAAAPVGRRWFFFCLGPLVGALLGMLSTALISFLMFGRSNLLGPVLLGGFLWALLGGRMLTERLMRSVWGLDYRGER